MKRTDMATL